MDELGLWIDRQVRRERAVVRLEDALLGNRFARYFVYRLRFFVVRTVVSTFIHALKIVLLLGAFARSEFVAIVVLQSALALSGDFWWGALEEMRGRVRGFQRRAARHLIPRQIAAWLTLSAGLALVGLSGAGGYVAYRVVAGGLGPADAFAAALVIGISLDLVARTYHSGAYAMRRVYRPLPSLLALDVVSVGVLLALWPFIGLWAFPVAELLSVLTVVAISIYFTTRTYRTLALPTLGTLLRAGSLRHLRRSIPEPAALRASLAPGVAYGLVGLEGLIVVAGVFGATTASGQALITLLAALAPVNRASFEWARLLYFDLKRMDLPLLAGLRARFDHAALALAVAVALLTWAVSAVVGVWVVADVTALLVGGLLALFVARSLLAAVQMQAFTRLAYARLTAVGVLGVAAVISAFVLFPGAESRLLAVAAVLGLSFALLLVLPPGPAPTDGVVPLSDWLRRLRAVRGPVRALQLVFDARLDARGTTVEVRRTEAWRRREVARRVGERLVRADGRATWVTPTRLWCFEPAGRASVAATAVALGAGLVDRPALVTEHADGAQAAVALAGEVVGSQTFAGAGAGVGAGVAGVGTAGVAGVGVAGFAAEVAVD
ncbi:MAG TPA: hypothetical protein VJK49_00150, partial [Candidatus Limnocylindrales bacterium]|nr:hypothetical protein [Candidatus Limnocylindrales bacterium]